MYSNNTCTNYQKIHVTMNCRGQVEGRAQKEVKSKSLKDRMRFTSQSYSATAHTGFYSKHILPVSMYVPPSTPASPSTTVNSNALSDAHQVRLWGSRVEFLFYCESMSIRPGRHPTPSKPLNKLYSSNPTNRTIQRLSRHSTEQPLEWTTTTNECLSKREAIQRTVDLEANSHFINRRDIDVIVVCARVLCCKIVCYADPLFSILLCHSSPQHLKDPFSENANFVISWHPSRALWHRNSAGRDKSEMYPTYLLCATQWVQNPSHEGYQWRTRANQSMLQAMGKVRKHSVGCDCIIAGCLLFF